MTLPQTIPDLPDKLQQRKEYEAWAKKEGKRKAKELIGFAKYSPLVVVVPFVQWLISVWPEAWLVRADGRGEAEFHHYTPKKIPFDPSRWEKIDGETWYFTRRNDRFCDIAYSYLPGLQSMIPLYQAQTPEWQAALPWRVTLWEDTELPANFPIRMPSDFVQHVTTAYSLSFDKQGHGTAGPPKGPMLNIDTPTASPETKARGGVPSPKGATDPTSEQGRATYGKSSGAGALVIGGLALVAVLAMKGR